MIPLKDGLATTGHANWSGIHSALDRSVNFSRGTPDGGMLECRYVRRSEAYFIVYVSTHSGCSHACRFCHLTQSRQVMFQPASIAELGEQLRQVLHHHDTRETPAGRMNINFMARGDPLSNPELMAGFGRFARLAVDEAASRGMTVNLNLSTIFPKDSDGVDLETVLRGWPVRIYWSLYALDPAFRKRWLPRAQNPEVALGRLLRWQAATGNEVIVHGALIAGENDRDEDFHAIAAMVKGSGLKARLNLVRYNPWTGATGSQRAGQEAGEERYRAALEIIGGAMTLPRSKIVPRVGMDVMASCGMFLPASGSKK